MATNEKIIETYLLNGVVELIGKALGSVDKLLVSIKKYVKEKWVKKFGPKFAGVKI